MPRYYPSYSGVANPSLSAGMFTDPSQLHVSAGDLSDAGSYGIAAPVANRSLGYGPGWSPNGQSWSNDYQFDDSASGALQRAGVSSIDAGQFAQQQAIQQAIRSAAMAAQQRQMAMAAQANPRPQANGVALTDSLADNRILGGIQNPQGLGLMLQRRTDAQMNPQIGYGIVQRGVPYSDVGTSLSIDGQNIPIPDGVDPDAFAQQQQARVTAARAAALGTRSKFDVFSGQPEIRDLGAPAQQALYESRYGAKPDASKQIDNINRQLDAYTKAYGINPIAAVNEMEAQGAKEGFVISMPGKFDKGASGSSEGTYVPGPNVHLAPGLVSVGRKMRKAQAEALAIPGDLTAPQYPFGYDPTQRSTDKNQILMPAATSAPLLRQATTPAPASTREVKVFNGKRYLVDHTTRAVTPLDQ